MEADCVRIRTFLLILQITLANNFYLFYTFSLVLDIILSGKHTAVSQTKICAAVRKIKELVNTALKGG